MAEFIPDQLPARASRGEERTFSLLKKLPDNYLVYYEPNIDNRRPDFIIIAPDLGVIIIEVKGWNYNDILRANDNEIVINNDNRERNEIHPLEQARKYQWRLVGVCEKHPNRSLLLHSDGQHKNKFIFPFCHFVVLSNITRDTIERHQEHDLYKIFRPENTMYRDELVGLENASPEKLRKSLEKYFDPWWPITPLTDEQVDVLRSIIHPEIILSPISSKSLPEEETDQCVDLVVLDRRQENNARKIGEGHRIICGVAGSGKTVLLIARAKWLHERDPASKILLLCYNVVLSVSIKHVLEDYPRIHVFHFDGWVKHNGIHPRIKDPLTGVMEDDVSLGNRLLEHLKKRSGDYRNYDAILVDEAQDFPPIWFSCILEALTDPLDGELLIVCDGNQGIRPIDSVSWKSIGIKAKGRTIHQAFDLDRNYRNTRGILKLASHFTAKNDEDSISIIPVDPNQAMRRGSKPILFKCKDHSDECKKIITTVKQFLEGKVTFKKKIVKLFPHEIGILYHGISERDEDVFQEFLQELSSVSPVTWLSSKDHDSRKKVFEKTIKVQTVHSAKGIQYRAVFVMWTDLFKPYHPEDTDREQRLLYVALTRASDVLIITYSESNEFIERMIASGDAECR
jgi:hypothetical protein